MRLGEGRMEAEVICVRLKGAVRKGMTNDQEMKRHEATRVIEEKEIKVR